MSVLKVSEKLEPLFDPNSPYRHIGIWGGRGSGKSHGAGQAVITLCDIGHERVIYGRQFHASFKQSVKKLLKDKIQVMGLESRFEILENEIRHRYTESTINFIGLDRSPNSIRSLEGATLTVMEEAQDINQESIDVLIPTVFRRKGARMWWMWNPLYETTPVDLMFRGLHRQPQSLVIDTSWRDNPYFFEVGMDVEARHLKKTNKQKYLHIWEGHYFDGAEFKIFPNCQVKDIEVPEHVIPQYGLDFGVTGDPNSLIKIYVNEKERWIYLAKECFAAVPTEDFIDLINSDEGIPEAKASRITGDSAAAGAIATMNKNGFNVVGAKKGAGSVLDGINWLHNFTIYISPSCPRMIEEAKMYSWQKDKHTKKPIKVPEDDFNHGWDAVRYGVEENRLSKVFKGSKRV